MLNRVLSPAAMKRLRERFAAAAERRMDDLLERGSFDAIPDFAEAYPPSVFPDALGMPREGREHVLLPAHGGRGLPAGALSAGQSSETLARRTTSAQRAISRRT